jgi:hypothetical protein
MTQGKIERYHRSLKNRILLENYYLPGQLEVRLAEFVDFYNTRRYHESLAISLPPIPTSGADQPFSHGGKTSNVRPSNYGGGCISRRSPEPLTRWARRSLVRALNLSQLFWRRTTRQKHHLDLQAGRLRLEPGESKNKEGRMFPLTPELREVLERQVEWTRPLEIETGKVIPWLFHRQGEPIKDFRAAWENACERGATMIPISNARGEWEQPHFSHSREGNRYLILFSKPKSSLFSMPEAGLEPARGFRPRGF